MATPKSPAQNQLLESLTFDEYARILPKMELVSLEAGQVLYDSGCKLSYVYFPTTCIASLVYLLENGASTEIAMIGNDGVVGIALFTGGDSMPNRAVVLISGYAYRLPKQLFLQELNRSERLHRLLLRYTLALITQITQMAVCNRHHSIEQQLCHWLLLSLDRLQSNEMFMTHELIANLLGVRRETITEVAGKLQRAGLINYQRGHITVLNRSALEQRSCECYWVVKTESDRLLAVRPQGLHSVPRALVNNKPESRTATV